MPLQRRFRIGQGADTGQHRTDDVDDGDIGRGRQVLQFTAQSRRNDGIANHGPVGFGLTDQFFDLLIGANIRYTDDIKFLLIVLTCRCPGDAFGRLTQESEQA